MTITHGFKPVFRDAVALSGTSVDFSDIPSWVRRITIPVAALSLSGTANVLFQLGDSGGVEATGYVVNDGILLSTSVTVTNRTTGFMVPINAATYTVAGEIQFTLLDPSTNLWTGRGLFMGLTAATTHYPVVGYKALSGALDRVRLTTSNGTDTFDAGTARIILE